MQAVLKPAGIAVEEYLADELASPIRHEYLGGFVYAMAGETLAHNQIAQNLLVQIRSRIKGGPCRVFISDVRVNLRLHTDEYFYYPDLVVTCDRRDNHPRFVRHPKLIIEVLSESTERVDKREKFFAYTSLPSLQEYTLVAQTAREVTVFRRRNQWKAEISAGAGTALKLESLKARIALAALYEGV